MSAPRRASPADTEALARLFAAAFLDDPVMDWIARSDASREAALTRFFAWLLSVRALPYGEVWMADDGTACAAWLPPDAPASPGGFVAQLRLLPMFLRLCGFARLARGQAIGDALEKHHPSSPHFYLAFVAVAPAMQGKGLGRAILEETLRRVDAAGADAYLENSNPKNTRLYEQLGFCVRGNIAPEGSPPLLGMWREKRAS